MPKPSAERLRERGGDLALSLRKRFAEEYIVDMHGHNAALRAGYSVKTAKRTASQLLGNPEVQDLIAEERRKQQERTQITADRVIQELAAIGFANVFDYGRVEDGQYRPDLTNTTRQQAAGLAGVTVTERRAKDGEDTVVTRETKLRIGAKREALVDLGRHLGLFVQEGAPTPNVTFVLVGAPPAKA